MRRGGIAACLLLVGCFSDPPSAPVDGGSTSAGSSSSTTASITTGVTADPTTSGGVASSSESSGSESTGEPTCGDAFECVVPPEDWQGPIVLRVEDMGPMPPECPSGTDEVWRGGSDPTAGCNCSDCSVGSTLCTVDLQWGGNGECNTPVVSTGCTPISSDETAQFTLSFETEPTVDGSCIPPEPSPAGFRSRAVACEPPGQACPGGGTCVTGRTCVWRPGDHMCPPAFEDRVVFHDTVTGDELSCDDCECGGVVLECSGAEITVYETEDCSGPTASTPLAVGPTRACSGYDGAPTVITDAIGSVFIDVDGDDCAPAEMFVPATGSFVPEGPRTVCCTG